MLGRGKLGQTWLPPSSLSTQLCCLQWVGGIRDNHTGEGKAGSDSVSPSFMPPALLIPMGLAAAVSARTVRSPFNSRQKPECLPREGKGGETHPVFSSMTADDNSRHSLGRIEVEFTLHSFQGVSGSGNSSLPGAWMPSPSKLCLGMVTWVRKKLGVKGEATFFALYSHLSLPHTTSAQPNRTFWVKGCMAQVLWGEASGQGWIQPYFRSGLRSPSHPYW